MSQKSKLYALVQELSNGNFLKMVGELESGNMKIDSLNFVKIVVGCYMGLDNNIKRKTWSGSTKEFLFVILNAASNNIRSPTNEYIISYLQSAHHIVKLLLEADDLSYVLKLKSFLLPKFMPPSLTPEQKSIYVSMGTVIFKLVARKSQTDAAPPDLCLYDLCMLSSELWNKHTDRVTYLNNCYHCLKSLTILNFENDLLKKYYSYVLSSCKSIPDDCQEDDLFLSLINFLQARFTNNLKNNISECVSTYKEWLRTAKKLFSSKQYQILCEVVEFNCLILIHKDVSLQTLKNCHSALKTYFNMHSVDNCLRSVCQMILNTFFRMTSFYKNEGKCIWLDIPVDTQLKIFNFCSDVAHILSKTPFTCTCEKCNVNLSHFECVMLLASVVSLARKCISGNRDVSRKYKLDVLQCIEKALASIITLKEHNCDKWKSCWREIGIHLYNMCINMYKFDDADGLSYINVFTKHLINIEGSHISTVIGDSISYSAFILLTEVYLKANELRKCLVITALLLVLFPEKRELEFNRWMKIKITAKETSLLEAQDNIQNMTVCSALTDYKNEVTEYIPNFELTHSEKIELTVFELAHYKQRWKSKISMMSAYKNLTQIADLNTLVDVTVQIWSDFSAMFHDDIPRLIHSVVAKCEKNFSRIDKLESGDIKLAFLYFTYYVLKFKITIAKNHIDVEENVNFMKNIESHKNGLPSDPNDSCDIVSSYQRLKIEKHVVIIKYLNKSLSLIASFCKSERYLDHFKVWNLGDVYDLLIKIAYEYRMHNNHLPYLHASELALKIAEYMEDDLKVLKAITNLLDVADAKACYVHDLIEKADNIVSRLNCETEDSQRSVISYYFYKGNAYINADVAKATESFKKADALYSSWKWKDDPFLNAQLHMLHAKLIMLPCENNIEGHKEFSLVKIHLAHTSAVTALSKQFGVDTSYKMSIVLDVKDTLIKMHHSQNLPREVRCYARDAVLLTQDFLLPLRTVSLLVYLAHADLLSCRLDDYNTKISGISDILCLGKYKMITSPQKLGSSPCKLDAEIVNSFSSLNLQEVSLDLPSSRCKQMSPGSPTLMLEPFTLPHFVHHNSVCDCFYCNCMEYQTLVFHKIHLEASFNVYQNNLALAQDFFYGCSKMRTHLYKKEKYYVHRACQIVHKDLVIYPRHFYVEPYCHIMLDYCNSLLKLNNKKSPKKVNQEMIDFLKPMRSKYNILYVNFVLQKILIDFKMSNAIAYDAVLCLEPPTAVNELLLTPESKHSKVTFPVKCSPLKTLSRPKRAVKSIIFDLTDQDDTIVPANKNPEILGSRTPLPPKINIYAPDSIKSTRKKKSEVAKSDGSNQISVPASTAASKIPEKLKLGLQTKTKLLTQRLKLNDHIDTAKIENNENEASQANVEPSTRSSSRRKVNNNVERYECNQNGTDKNTGAVKRSARLRK